MTNRTRVLVVALALTVAAWTSWSVHSPFHGWVAGIVARTVTAVLRWNADAPCSACAFAPYSIGGITVRYPVVLLGVPMPSGKIDAVTFAAKRCGLFVAVSPTPVRSRELMRTLERKDTTVLEERTVNGWEVFIEQGHGRSHAEARIFDDRSNVFVSAILDERLVDTDLSRWIDTVFKEAVESVYRDNAASMSGGGRSP